VNLGDACWPDLEAAAPSSVLVVPVGSTEQHGPHLPLSTDTDIAVELASRLGAARPDVVIAPALAYGSAGEHSGFPGTLSIGQAAFESVIVELVRSAGDFAAVVLVCAHGGNAEPLDRAVTTLRGEGRSVLGWIPRGYADAHAGRTETSLLLALDAGRVRIDAAEPGPTAPFPELIGALRDGGVRAVSPNGVLGDPSGASAREGHELFDAIASNLIEDVERFLV
jgi:creatinine amidohydrolase